MIDAKSDLAFLQVATDGTSSLDLQHHARDFIIGDHKFFQSDFNRLFTVLNWHLLLLDRGHSVRHRVSNYYLIQKQCHRYGKDLSIITCRE